MTTSNNQPKVEKVEEKALTIATVSGQAIVVTDDIRHVCDVHGNLQTAKRWLCQRNNLPFDPKQKLSDLKKSLGEKAKAQLKEYNAGRQAKFSFDAKVNALIAADATLRKSVKTVVNSKGQLIGFNTSARFMKDPSAAALAQENTDLKARLAALEAKFASLPAPAKA